MQAHPGMQQQEVFAQGMPITLEEGSPGRGSTTVSEVLKRDKEIPLMGNHHFWKDQMVATKDDA